jgi:hypothetical protein
MPKVAIWSYRHLFPADFDRAYELAKRVTRVNEAIILSFARLSRLNPRAERKGIF